MESKERRRNPQRWKSREDRTGYCDVEWRGNSSYESAWMVIGMSMNECIPIPTATSEHPNQTQNNKVRKKVRLTDSASISDRRSSTSSSWGNGSHSCIWREIGLHITFVFLRDTPRPKSPQHQKNIHLHVIMESEVSE